MSPFNDPFASSRPPGGGRPPGSNIPYRPGPGNAPKPSGRPSWAAKPASYYFGDQQGPPPNPNLDSYNSQNANMWDIPTDYDPNQGAPPVSRPPEEPLPPDQNPIGDPRNHDVPPEDISDPTREERLTCKSQGGTWKGNKLKGVCVPGGGGGGGGGGNTASSSSSSSGQGTLDYKQVLPDTREVGNAERSSIYDEIFRQLRNPNTESTSRLRSLYEGIPGFTKNLVGDWRNDDYGLFGDLRSRFSKHGEEGAGDSTKNLIAERGAGAIRGLHDDVSRNRSAAFARNPYSVDSNLGPDTLGKTGQAFADNSRNAAFQGGLLDERAKEFGLGGIKDIDFARFGAAERGDERFRGTGATTEFGIRDRNDTQGRQGIDQLLSLYGGAHGPTSQEAGYDLSRRDQDLREMLTRLGISSSSSNAAADRDWRGGQAGLDRTWRGDQAGLDRDLTREQQEWMARQAGLDRDSQADIAESNKAPWWSHFVPNISLVGGGG